VTGSSLWSRWAALASGARGSAGVVVARTAERLIAVRFDTGPVEHVQPADLAYEEPAG
jgi:hypothetical protein